MNQDPSYFAAVAVIIIVAMAILIQLIPLLFQAVWQIMPGVLILLIVVSVISGMIKELFH